MNNNRYLLLLAGVFGGLAIAYGGYQFLKRQSITHEGQGLSEERTALELREAQEMLGIKKAPTEQQKQAEKRLENALKSTSQSIREEAAVALLDLYLITDRNKLAAKLAKIDELQGSNMTRASTVTTLLEIYQLYGETKAGEALIEEAAQNPMLEKNHPTFSVELKITDGLRQARIKYDAKEYNEAQKVLEKVLGLATKDTAKSLVGLAKDFLTEAIAWQAIELLEQGQLKEADALWKKTMSLCPDPVSYVKAQKLYEIRRAMKVVELKQATKQSAKAKK